MQNTAQNAFGCSSWLHLTMHELISRRSLVDHQEYLDRRVHRSLLSRAARVYFQSERWREKGRSLTASACGTRISRFLFYLFFLFFLLSAPQDHLSLYAGNYVRAIANGRETGARFNRISRDLSRKFVAGARS